MNTIKAHCKLILEQKGSGEKKEKNLKKKKKTSKTKAKMLAVLSGDPGIYITDFLT